MSLVINRWCKSCRVPYKSANPRLCEDCGGYGPDPTHTFSMRWPITNPDLTLTQLTVLVMPEFATECAKYGMRATAPPTIEAVEHDGQPWLTATIPLAA